jgi:hypothetical protein
MSHFMPYKDPAKTKAHNKANYEKNRQHILERQKKYNEVHKQEIAEYKKSNRLRNIWYNMKHRCYNPKNIGFKNYGGRGITVCDEWRNDYSAFERWALTNGYAPDLTNDRINNDGNYEPGNCQWIPNANNVAKGNRERKR